MYSNTGDKMGKRLIYILGFVLLFAALIFGITGGSNEASVSDSAYYVEGDMNIFIKTAKLCDKCCYYLVDFVLDGIEKVFGMILGD